MNRMKEPDLLSSTKEVMKEINNHQQQNGGSLVEKLKKTNSNSSLNNALSPSKVCIEQTPSGYKLPNNVNVLICNNQIKELHTVLRDRETSHSDFKFYSDRLIRLLVEEGLNELPYKSCKITTPAGCEYEGNKYIKGICGVSIMRSGEAMEKGLRECCRSIRIGKILIQSNDEDTKKSSVVYAKFPSDINARKILLMYPIMTTGSTVNLAIKCLKEHDVTEINIIVLCLFSTPSSLQSLSQKYPHVHILTSEIHPFVPTDFGQRYFGTE